MVEEDIVKIASRYLRRDYEKIEEAFEKLEIRSLEDLADADPNKIAEAFSIKKSTAERMIAEAQYYVASRVRGKASVRDDVDVPPVIAKLALLSASRGTVLAALEGPSFCGKTTLCSLVSDRVIPSKRTGSLSIAGLAKSLSRSRRGTIIDDAQRIDTDSTGADTMARIARTLADKETVDGTNITHESRMTELVQQVRDYYKAILVTVDTMDSNRKLPIQESDMKRVLRVPAAPSPVSLTWSVEKWLLSDTALDFAVKPGINIDDDEYADYSDVYKAYAGTGDIPGIINATLSSVASTLGESGVSAAFKQHKAIFDVADMAVIQWWKETTESYFAGIRFDRNAEGSERQRQGISFLVPIGLSSLMSVRYEWDVSNWNEVREALEMTVEAVRRVLKQYPGVRVSFFREKLEDAMRKAEPPF